MPPSLFLPLLLAAACQATEGPPGAGPPAAEPPVTVAAVGASLPAGANLSLLGVRTRDGSEAPGDVHTFVEVLEAWEPGWRIETFADEMFFLDPEVKGAAQIGEAWGIDPDVVLALDFLFWFGYGAREDADRVAYMEEVGLPLLEELWAGDPEEDRPAVLVSLLPDVRSSRILVEGMKPSDEALAALNRAIRAWVERHANVRMVPLDERVAELRRGGEVRVGGTVFGPGDLRTLLLDDDLHPTTRGSVLVAALCLERLRAFPDPPPMRTDPAELDLRAAARELMERRSEAVPAGSRGAVR